MPPAPPEPERVGPIVLLPALLVLLLGLTLLWRRSATPPPEHPHAPPAPLATEVAAWSSTLDLAGARLTLRVAPLHADPARQAFDAATLARRLGLPPGEPWLVRLDHAPADTAPPATAPAVLPASLAIVDAAGAPRLVPLRTAPPEPAAAPEPADAPDAPADPLRVLLAPPTAPLAAGASLRLVLWGTRPRAGDRARARLADGRVLEAPLAARPLAGAELYATLHGPLTRLAPAAR